MSEFLEFCYEWVPKGLQFIGWLTCLGTFIARLTPTEVDDRFMSKISKIMRLFVRIMPTIGTNPETEGTVQRYKNLKKKYNVQEIYLKEKYQKERDEIDSVAKSD